jgi:hypothetical protein
MQAGDVLPPATWRQSLEFAFDVTERAHKDYLQEYGSQYSDIMGSIAGLAGRPR